MNRLAHQLLPLLISLSPLESEEQMRTLFLEAVNSALDGLTLRYVPGGRGLDLVVSGEVLGAFEIDSVDGKVPEESVGLLHNAVAVLGLFMERRRQERALSADKRRTEAKYRQLVEHVPVGLFEMDAAGNCIYVNQQWCDIAGTPAVEAMGRSWMQLIHPADRDAVVERFKLWVGSDRNVDDRFRYLRPDGEVRHVWASARPEYADDGSICGYVGAVTDVTPVREAEAALQENEARLHLTLEAVEEAVLEYNRQTHEVYFSPRFYRMLGYEPGEVPATREFWWALVHPDDADSGAAALRNVYADLKPFCLDFRMRHRAGDWRWIRARGRVLTRSATGNAVRILGTALDVTEQREAEEELRLILRTCFDGFLVVGQDLRILDANDAYCQLIGYSREELLNLSVTDVKAGGSRETVTVTFSEVRTAGWKRLESTHRRKDGTLMPLEVNLSWSPTGGGRYIGFVRDLTGRNRMLKQLSDSETQYRALVTNQAGVVFTAAGDGTLTYASPQTQQLFGCLPSSWVGRRLIDMVDDAYTGEIQRQWTRTLSGEAVAPLELEFRCCAGRPLCWVAISLSPQRGEDGMVASVLGTMWNVTERKHVEESLQRSEEQFRSVWEQSSDGMRLSDGAGTVLRVNDAFCQMFGRTREEIEGRPLKECYGPEEWARIHEGYLSRYPSAIAAMYESHMKLWNGTQKWFEVSNSLIPRPGGPEVLSIFRDITQRKATEAHLSVLARAFEQSPASVVVTDTSGRIEFVNPKFCEITGYSADEVRGQNPRILKSGMNQDSLYDELWIAITDGREWHGEMLNRRRDGTMFWEQASISPVKSARGEVTHFVAVKEDITERKRVQHALEESERRFREMLERVELLALLLDGAGNVTFCNDFFCRVTGWTREQLMGNHYVDLLIPEGARETMGNQLEPHRENEILTADGRRLLIAWDNTALRGPSGEFAGMASLGRDVTSHRLLEEQYRQAQKLESLGRLAGGVAHDFNNLLTVINGYSEMMLEQFPVTDPAYAKVREIFRAGLRASELTKQLLAFSRKQMIERQVMQLNDLLAEVKGMLQRLIGENIRLEVHTGPVLGHVEADPSQIHQVLMNLVVNARDAMPKGGVLRIETSPLRVAEGGATDWDLPPGEYAQLIVSDTGAGMDPETQAHAFEPFFTTKSGEKGTGLGLATVYGIVRQNGGGIQFESHLGAGTRFRIALPVCGKPLTAPGEAARNPERGSESVLLVEDQVEVRRLAATILKTFGYDVYQACDGLEGLKMAGEQTFDLLLSDLVMPNLGGYELAQKVVRMQPAIRVLFMSGYAGEDHGELPENLHAGFIAKPFSPNMLAARVRETLDA